MTRKGETERMVLFMAIDAKISFMNQVEKRLSTEVTADAMSRIMPILADVMEGFEMRETFITESPNDDLLTCYLTL